MISAMTMGIGEMLVLGIGGMLMLGITRVPFTRRRAPIWQHYKFNINLTNLQSITIIHNILALTLDEC